VAIVKWHVKDSLVLKEDVLAPDTDRAVHLNRKQRLPEPYNRLRSSAIETKVVHFLLPQAVLQERPSWEVASDNDRRPMAAHTGPPGHSRSCWASFALQSPEVGQGQRDHGGAHSMNLYWMGGRTERVE